MIIDNLRVARIAVLPNKADAKLVVDADAMLPCPVSRQLLQAVSGGAIRFSRSNAAFRIASLLNAERLMLAGILRLFPVFHKDCVSASRKPTIMLFYSNACR